MRISLHGSVAMRREIQRHHLDVSRQQEKIACSRLGDWDQRPHNGISRE
jgi:hypothetical protein